MGEHGVFAIRIRRRVEVGDHDERCHHVGESVQTLTVAEKHDVVGNLVFGGSGHPRDANESALTGADLDVAHGFGVYNPKGALIFQAQVVPDHDQKIVHTFTQPGIYTVHCLEFCGVGHGEMSTTFEVKPA